MTISVGAHTSWSTQTAVVPPSSSSSITTQASGSSFVGVQLSFGPDATSVFSDNKGNTFNLIGTASTGLLGGMYAAIYLCINGTGGTGHVGSINWTYTGGNSGFVMGALIEILGGATSGLLDQIAAWFDDTSSPYISNSITTANANDLLIAVAATEVASGTEVLTWGNSFTALEAQGNAAGTTGGVATRLVSATGTYNSSVTSTLSTETVSIIFSLKAGGVTPPPPAGPLPRRLFILP